jgi:hypothetical protein
MPQSKRKKAEKAREARKAEKALKTKAVAEEKLAPVPKAIQINFGGANQKRSFTSGEILRVPEDVPEDSARSWLGAGKAEAVKIPPGPSETKVIEPEETKDEKPEVTEEPTEEDKSEEEPAETK